MAHYNININNNSSDGISARDRSGAETRSHFKRGTK